jgi:hypothetical protein
MFIAILHKKAADKRTFVMQFLFYSRVFVTLIFSPAVLVAQLNFSPASVKEALNKLDLSCYIVQHGVNPNISRQDDQYPRYKITLQFIH